MLVQRKPPRLLDLVTELPAATQHDFPKPDIQIWQIGRNLFPPFAALPFYVSHAGLKAQPPALTIYLKCHAQLTS